MDLTYESLPQREPRTKRRRQGAAGASMGEEANVEPPAEACSSVQPPCAADTSGPAAEPAAVAPLPERARGLASASGAGAQSNVSGAPQLQHIDMPEYRTSAVAGQKFECERLCRVAPRGARGRGEPLGREHLCPAARHAHGSMACNKSGGAAHSFPMPVPAPAQTWTIPQMSSCTHVRGGPRAAPRRAAPHNKAACVCTRA